MRCARLLLLSFLPSCTALFSFTPDDEDGSPTCAAGVVTEIEANDDAAHAMALCDGANVRASFRDVGAAPRDADWYSVELSAGDGLLATTYDPEHDSCSRDTVIVLYVQEAAPAPVTSAGCLPICDDQSGEGRIDCVDDVGGSLCARVSYGTATDATAYLRVLEACGATGEYDLQIEITR